MIKIAFLSEPRVCITDQEFFFKVVRSAFGQRRKILLNSLASNLNLPKKEVGVILNKISIDPQRRAETLSLNEFADLTSGMEEMLK